MRKQSAWVLYLAAYLTIWAGFGVAYWGIALSDPANYTYQQDILLERKAQRFLRSIGMAEYSTQELEEKCKTQFQSYDRGLEPLLDWYEGAPSRPIPHFTIQGYGGIGWDWADYYCQKYMAQGMVFFSYTLCQGINSQYVHMKTTLYALSQTSEGNAISKPAGIVELEIPIVSFSRTVAPVQAPQSGKLLPISRYLRRFLAQSVMYPDDDILELYRIDRQGCTLGLVDFLYFSAVTVATLGYGDIAPNCSLVRGLVMIETLTGTALFGLFLAAFYDFLSNRYGSS